MFFVHVIKGNGWESDFSCGMKSCLDSVSDDAFFSCFKSWDVPDDAGVLVSLLDFCWFECAEVLDEFRSSWNKVDDAGVRELFAFSIPDVKDDFGFGCSFCVFSDFEDAFLDGDALFNGDKEKRKGKDDSGDARGDAAVVRHER